MAHLTINVSIQLIYFVALKYLKNSNGSFIRHLSIKVAYDLRFACPCKKLLYLGFVKQNCPY
jgi:hypothetical protein